MSGSIALDTIGESVPYLASWAQAAPLETIEATAKLIDRLARRIEDALEGAAEAAEAEDNPCAGAPHRPSERLRELLGRRHFMPPHGRSQRP